MLYRGRVLSSNPANHTTVHDEVQELEAIERGFERWDGVTKETPAAATGGVPVDLVGADHAFDVAAVRPHPGEEAPPPTPPASQRRAGVARSR